MSAFVSRVLARRVLSLWERLGVARGALFGFALDVWRHAWGMSWFIERLSTFELPWEVKVAAFPERRVLWYVDPLGALLTAPLQALSGPAVAWNVLLTLELTLCGWAAWLFGRALGGRGWLAAAALTTTPLLQTELWNGVSEACWLAPIPLAGALAARRSKYTGVAIGLAWLATPYHGFGATGLGAAILLMGGVGGERPPWATRLKELALALVIGAALALPQSIMLKMSVDTDAPFVNRPLWDGFNEPSMRTNAVDPRSLFMPGDFWSRETIDTPLSSPWKHTPYLGLGVLAPGVFGLGVQRGALFSALWDAVHAAGLEVRTGLEVGAVAEDPTGVSVAGARFDRAIIASGARSGLRPPGATVRPYPWGALWAVVRSELSPHCLTQRYRDTRQMFGVLPSGQGTLSMFWSIRADRVEAWRAAGMEAWKDQIRALYADAPVETLNAPEQILFAPYFDVVAPRWHTERVLWIGDAAHAMSPQLGQGANLALMDAAAVADCGDFAEWSARRRSHLRFYQLASRLLTPFFQSSFPVLAPLRDLVAGPLHAWGWYQRQMLESLVGVKTGLFSRLQLEDRGAVAGEGTG